MNRVVLCVSGLMVLVGSLLNGQTITGTWQGTLPIAENPRIVLKIAKADDGSLRGTFYRIDQYADSLPLSSISFQAPELTAAAVALDISYRGTLDPDGRSITGVWKHAKQSYPLILVLATPETVWRYGGALGPKRMSATADPAFEVATIKPSRPDAKGQSYGLRSRQFVARKTSVEDLLEFAYKMRSRQIAGGPSWMAETKFDIVAEPDTAGVPSDDQDRLMLKKLLAERFHLTLHVVRQSFPAYALTVEKKSSKVTNSDLSDSDHGHIYTKEGADGQMLVQFAYETIPEFAGILMNFIQDRQIVDETGLTGPFDFTLTIPTRVLQGGQTAGLDDTPADAFMRAVRPLGFKLVPKKALLDVIVIDRLDQPSPN